MLWNHCKLVLTSFQVTQYLLRGTISKIFFICYKQNKQLQTNYQTHIPHFKKTTITTTTTIHYHTQMLHNRDLHLDLEHFNFYLLGPGYLKHFHKTHVRCLQSLSRFIAETTSIIHQEKQGTVVAFHSFSIILFANDIPNMSLLYSLWQWKRGFRTTKQGNQCIRLNI